MRRGSSTLLTRLALALLAVLGFVAPLSAAEGDRVVQTVGGKPAPLAAEEVRPAALARSGLVAGAAPLHLTVRPGGPRGLTARRYLLHRAWLV